MGWGCIVSLLSPIDSTPRRTSLSLVQNANLMPIPGWLPDFAVFDKLGELGNEPSVEGRADS
jgi:hypothetical protein